MLKTLIEQLIEKKSLSADEVKAAVAALIDAQVEVETKAEFLTRLAEKGETVEEIAAFAAELRSLSICPELDEATRAGEIVDVCGTGGDRLNTFNISTTVALVTAAAGLVVAKHGNRAVTGTCGSADVLEALGVRIDLSPAEAAQWLRNHGFAFFFAPHFHPAFKQIGPARKLCAEKGQRTLFNFMGPLLNPARPTAQLVGVARPHLCELLGKVLQSLGIRRGMVVCGQVGEFHLDELSTLGSNTIAEFYQDRGFANSTLDPTAFPLQPSSLAQLAGGDKAANAEIVRLILSGTDRGPKRDAVQLNASAALFVANACKSLAEGWDRIGEVIDSGAATRKLEQLVQASRG
jgi:anthranilate phosphoribosyltransferase